MNSMLIVDYDKLHGSVFEKQLLNDVVYSNLMFSDTLSNKAINLYFGDERKPLSHFGDFDPKIETVVIDIYEGKVVAMILAFDAADGYDTYGLINRRGENDYYITLFKDDYDEINIENFKTRSIGKELSNKIIPLILNSKIEDIACLNDLINEDEMEVFKFDLNDDAFINEIKSFIYERIKTSLKDCSVTSIIPRSYSVDVHDLHSPCFYRFYFESYGAFYSIHAEITVEADLKEYDELPYAYQLSDPVSSYLVSASKENFYSFNQDLHEKFKVNRISALVNDEIKKFYNGEYSSNNGKIIFPDIASTPFIIFDDNSITLYLSRNCIDEYEIHDHCEIETYPTLIKKCFDKFISSLSIKGKLFNDTYDKLNDVTTSFAETVDIIKNLEDIDKELSAFDKTLEQYKTQKLDIENKKKLINDVDQKKLEKVSKKINDIRDLESYNNNIDELFEMFEDLSTYERKVLENEISLFYENFGEYINYKPLYNDARRVFVRKQVMDEITEFNRTHKDLNLLGTLNSIVKELKTIPGEELGKYLVRHGVNRPVKNDPSIYKIRIKNKEKYRICFVFGDALGEERFNNSDSIYIFAFTEHEENSIQKLPQLKPDKYHINDYFLYVTNKNIRIPECSKEQYEVSTSYPNEATITFGCAGSGKTTVSIEQYYFIVISEYGSKSPTSEELVYVTFRNELAAKATNDLNEYNIQGNCYRLVNYFANVLNREIDEEKLISEKLFVDWFDTEFSEDKLAQNKYNKRSYINVFGDKPDIARLVYTYYRGVFRGSNELFNSTDPYLSQDKFMSCMNGEEYLSDEEKKAIYNLCLEFYKYAKREELVGDNELALDVIRAPINDIKRTKCIIIDEVQDLTEIELLALIKTLDKESNRIYFYGDPHQSINPNLFDASTINKVFTTLGKHSSSLTKPLNITYRTNKNLVGYLQELEEKRDKWIGLTSGGVALVGKPSETEDSDLSWAGYVTNRDLYETILCKNMPNCIIITPSNNEKEALLKRYPNVEGNRVITIYEAKGREWDTVIMYDMFTDYEKYFIDIISENGKAKHSTIHRMTFNKYYVGCTRSTKSFVLIEENQDIISDDSLIKNNLLDKFAPISKEDQINTYILENNTFDGWYQEALQNLGNENEAVFRYALEHAMSLVENDEERRQVNNLYSDDPKVLIPQAFALLERGEYKNAKGLFLKAYRKDKNCIKDIGEHITLCRLLTHEKIQKDRYIEALLKNKDLMEKYPGCYKGLLEQDYIKNKLYDAIHNFYDKKEK